MIDENCFYNCVTVNMPQIYIILNIDVNMPKNLLFPYDNCDEFSLDNFSEEECIAEFRVEKNDFCPFWQMPLEFHLFFVAHRGPCLKEWKACVCCLNALHILVVTVT